MTSNLPLWVQIILPIAIIWFLAWVALLAAPFGSDLLMWIFSRDARLRQERRRTLRGLVTGLLRLLIIILAGLATLGLYADIDSLIWMVGLFAAGFGLGARPFISDVLTGITFIYDHTFEVGEKIEVLDTSGVVENVGLRTIELRSPTGELYVIPNGEIRMIRNFSRGKFSQVKIRITIAAEKLDHAHHILQRLGHEVVALVPEVIEPWFITSDGDLADDAHLTISAKTRFGHGADTKPHLEALIQQRLTQAGIKANREKKTDS